MKGTESKVIEEFLTWHEKIKEQVQKVARTMQTPLSDEPSFLIRELQDIEAWNARINFLLADANGWLDKARAFYMPAKDTGSALDRETACDRDISPVRVVRDKLESLADCIKNRLILGESLLRYHTQFHDREIKSKTY